MSRASSLSLKRKEKKNKIPIKSEIKEKENKNYLCPKHLITRLDQKVGVEKDNDNQIFIKDSWLHSLYEIVIERPEVDIVEKIKKARIKDKEVVRVVEEMKKAGVKVVRGEEWQIKGDLVLKNI